MYALTRCFFLHRQDKQTNKQTNMMQISTVIKERKKKDWTGLLSNAFLEKRVSQYPQRVVFQRQLHKKEPENSPFPSTS